MHLKLEYESWGIAAWLTILTWIGIFVCGNCPFWHQHPMDRPVYDLRGYSVSPIAKSTEPEYEFTGISGWPIESLWINIPTQVVYRYYPIAMLANIVIQIGLLLSIATLFQNAFRQFSISTVFWLTALFGMGCAATGYLAIEMSLDAFHSIVMAIYFSPFAVVVGIWSHARARRVFRSSPPNNDSMHTMPSESSDLP